MFVFASAHVGKTAYGSKNKDETGVHHVRAGYFPSFVARTHQCQHNDQREKCRV
jgi:hypothetical protein